MSKLSVSVNTLFMSTSERLMDRMTNKARRLLRPTLDRAIRQSFPPLVERFAFFAVFPFPSV